MEFESNVKYIPDQQDGNVVYFVYDITNKITKIGMTSNNVKWRFKEMKMYNPHITLLFTISRMDYSTIESNLHSYFHIKHFFGEWFNLDKNDFIHVMKKYKNCVKRYKINNLLLELGATEDDIENLNYIKQPEGEKTIRFKKIDDSRKKVKPKSMVCDTCNKLLKRNEIDRCKQCVLDVRSLERMRQQRLEMGRNASYYLAKEK